MFVEFRVVPHGEIDAIVRPTAFLAAHLVPIDVCYELVGVVRPLWKGLGGGPEIWNRMGEFFAELDRRGVEVPRSGAA